MDPDEVDADWFAASLLMPENVFKYQWERFSGNHTKISHFFGTSITTVAMRAHSFGLD